MNLKFLQEQLYFFVCVYTYEPQVQHHPYTDSSFSYVTGHVAYFVTHMCIYRVFQYSKKLNQPYTLHNINFYLLS
jgi:hypothetical protein